MRSEVLVGDENPQFYTFNDNKMIIGSDETCDIVVSHNDVSRQHLIVVLENDNYYAMDRGSTNGSYLNEERLIPGRKVEFNTFFPIRLGTDILISLVSDEEITDSESSKIDIPIPVPKSQSQSQARASDDATRVISLKDLKSAKTETLVKKRTEVKKSIEAKKGPPKKKKGGFRIDKIHVIVGAMMAGAVYLNNPFKEKPVDQTAQLKADKKIKEQLKKTAPLAKKMARKKRDVPLRTLFSSFSSDLKCQTDIEKEACLILGKDVKQPWGAKESGTDIFLFVDEGPYLLEAVRILSEVGGRGAQMQQAAAPPPAFTPPPASAPIQNPSAAPAPNPSTVATPASPLPDSGISSGPTLPKPTNPGNEKEIIYNVIIPEHIKKKDVYELAVALFLSDAVNVDFSQNLLKGRQLLFGLFKNSGVELKLNAAMEIEAERLPGLKYLMVKRRFDAIRQEGMKVLSFTPEHYPFIYGDDLDI
jgi:pSer/pThr/pTyr-binding forkhead associated (FHA) protein